MTKRGVLKDWVEQSWQLAIHVFMTVAELIILKCVSCMPMLSPLSTLPCAQRRELGMVDESQVHVDS